MQSLFARANDALYDDLAGYVDVIRATISELPRARAGCRQVLAEVRLVQALIAFGSGPEVAELSRLALQLSNLWGVRDDLPVQASGFSAEIAESGGAVEQARRGIQIAARCQDAALAAELRTCFTNIIAHLEEQQRLLEACHARLLPFRSSPELTRKRLNLLVATAEARVPASPERDAAVATYSAVGAMLDEWATGIPLDGRAVELLERCLAVLSGADVTVAAHHGAVPLPARAG
jgi:hypothetical protein